MDLLQRQDKRRLAPRHARLEPALVKGLAEGAHATARAPPGYKAGSALCSCIVVVSVCLG
jgi:hypothetical protein